MKCPLRHATYIDKDDDTLYKDLDCLGAECAWWYDGQCCVRAAAVGVCVRKI